MRAVVRLAYEATCAFVPMLAVAAAQTRCRRRQVVRRESREQAPHAKGRIARTSGAPLQPSRKRRVLHTCGVGLFACYLLLVMWICGVGTLWDFLRGGAAGWRGQVNLTPFSPWMNPVTWLLNVVLFVPLGFLLPCLWRGYERLLPTLAAGFCFSLAIELSQLLNFRVTDVDDLIANTLGAVVGLLIFWLVRKALVPGPVPLHGGVGRRSSREAGAAAGFRGPAYEPWLYAIAMFLGVFFLYGARGHAEMRIVSWLDGL